MAGATQGRHAGERVGYGWMVNWGILFLIALVYIFPFLTQVANSFKTDEEATIAGLSLWSNNWTGAAYQTLFQNSNYGVWTMNSLIVTLFVTLGRVFFVSLAGYALARLHFPGRKVVFAMLIGVMSVPGVVLLIPKFLVIKRLGIYDTSLGMILPLLVDAAGVFIMKNFFESIPVAVEEAAGSTVPAPSNLLVGGAADGPSGADDDHHPQLPGLLERVEPLHHLDPVAGVDHPDQGCRVAGVRAAVLGQSVPDQARRGDLDDHPGGDHVLRVPEADHEHHGRRGQGLTRLAADLDRPLPRVAVRSVGSEPLRMPGSAPVGMRPGPEQPRRLRPAGLLAALTPFGARSPSPATWRHQRAAGTSSPPPTRRHEPQPGLIPGRPARRA